MEYENLKSEKTVSAAELPTTSANSLCTCLLEEIKKAGRMEHVADCINNALNTTPDSYDTFDDFLSANPGYEEKTHQAITPDERAALQDYSGYGFVEINSVARGFWNYEKMGKKTPEREEAIKDKARRIISAINKAPAPEKDFITYRGTNLEGFRGYKINSLQDLEKMKGQFMLEEGFTSSALKRENSFADRKEESLWVGKSDIEIHYHIPAGADGLLALTSTSLSLSTGHTEVLMDHDMLEYFTDVNFTEDGRAIMDAIMIPLSVHGIK